MRYLPAVCVNGIGLHRKLSKYTINVRHFSQQAQPQDGKSYSYKLEIWRLRPSYSFVD